ncbi:MAG: hypothetical protein NUV63_10820 [Gallionella sp.]|nr:hypothetical protein [Gallionella sp.]
MVNKQSNAIRIHPVGTRITDTKKAKMLAASAPNAFRKAQDVLTATDKYVNKSGLFSTEKSRIQKLQSECYELARALKNDGFMSDEMIQNGKAFVIVEFFSLFSDAYPNWQKEYEALERFVKSDSYLREAGR